MTPETAVILAQALAMRREAEDALIRAVEPVRDALAAIRAAQHYGEVYVHETRIINRIVSEEREE